MKNLGKVLSKREQKAIVGGDRCVELCPGNECQEDSDCIIIGGGFHIASPSCNNGYCGT